MIQCQLKLRMCKAQERECERWLYHLASVYNFAIRKIELNAKDKIYFSKIEFRNLLAGHSQRLGIPSHVIQGILCTAHDAWWRCFKGLSRKPRLKGARNKLNSIPFPDPIVGLYGSRVSVPGLGRVRFHKMSFPDGPIKSARIVKRASGWYLRLFVDCDPNRVPRISTGSVGIDPGFHNLLTLSSGEVISHPRELEASALRLAQAQRGQRSALSSRIQERIRSQRKDFRAYRDSPKSGTRYVEVCSTNQKRYRRKQYESSFADSY